MNYTKGPKRVHHTKWAVGNYYFRENGHAAFRLDSVHLPKMDFRGNTTGSYSATYVDGPKVTDTKTYLIEAIVEGENDMTNTLYEFELNGKTTFGTKIATNSSGLWVMEVKGSGEVVTVVKTKAEEVIPYSIGVKFMTTPDQTYHYTAPKDKFDLGFYLFENHKGQSLVQVVELDTKSKQATKEFTPTLKFVTEEVK